MNWGALARTLISRFLLLILMIIYFVPVIIFMIVPAKYRYQSRVIFKFVDWFYRSVLTFSFLPIKYVGVENIPQGPVIFAANHQSSLDIPLIGKLAHGVPHVWLAKSELMESPILRWVLPRTTVLVDQTSPKKAVRSLVEIIDLVNGKYCHLMIFPEGGRYTDGSVHEFFRGFAILAKKLGRPVVPIRIFGVNKVYPPDTFLVHWYPIKVVVGPPCVYQENEDDEAFVQRVYQWFIEQKE